jgi:cation:H+ antiporter
VIFDYAAFSIVFLVAAMAGGLLLLYFGGEWLTKGAVAMALHFRVSALVVGLTVVSMCTSAPEMVTSLISGWAGSPGIALGNILGSNLANVGLILALALIIAPSSSQDPLLRSEVLILIAVTILFYILSFVGGVSRLDGFVLVGITVAYLFYIVRRSRRQPPTFAENLEEEVEEAEVSMPVAIIAIVSGTLALAAGADLLVGASAVAAHRMGVSDFVIGLTVVAVGTSLPELATTLAAASRKQTGIIFGNIIGSNFFNIVLIGGALGVFVPIPVDPTWLRFEFPAMIFLTALLWVFVSMNRQVRRWEGAILLVLYAGIILASTLR